MDKVRETLLKIFNTIKERWLAIGKSARVIIFSVIGAVIVAVVVLSIILNQTGLTALYTDITNTELQEVATILRDELGIIGVTLTDNQVMVPSDQIDTIRMEMAVRGYPKTGWNNDIWNNGVNMFSTDTQITEIMRQQACAHLSAAINTLSFVKSSIVNITTEDKQNYVLEASRQDTRVSVIITIKDGEKLNKDQIEGIYTLVQTSVPGLKRENIGIVDQYSVTLTASDAPSELESLSIEERKMQIQNDFNRSMEAELEEKLNDFFQDVYRNHRVSVGSVIDYGRTVSESTEYVGANVDENGNQSGIVSERTEKTAAGGIAAEGGVIGTATNADISPDFPTIVAEAGQDMYYEKATDIIYDVNKTITQYESGPYTIKKITASVLIDETALTQEDETFYKELIARAIGTEPEFVSVMARPFTLKSPTQTLTTGLLPDTNRNTLIFIIIALGALLIILFFLAIMTSGSKKKRHVRSRLAAAAATAIPTGRGGGAGYEDEDMFGAVTAAKVTGTEAPVDYGITSLLAEEGESRENVLKNEIREFARTNPDIVAQLIRTWMKE